MEISWEIMSQNTFLQVQTIPYMLKYHSNLFLNVMRGNRNIEYLTITWIASIHRTSLLEFFQSSTPSLSVSWIIARA